MSKLIDSYTEKELRSIIRGLADTMTPEPQYKGHLVTSKGERFRLIMDTIGWYNMGAALIWTVYTLAGALVGAGYIEHDDDYAEETGKPAWVEQGAYILPAYQRKGIYSRVLQRAVRKLKNNIMADAQHTKENRKFWETVAPSLVYRRNPGGTVQYGWDPTKSPRTLHIWVGTKGTCECGAYTGPDPRLYWSKTANLPGGAKVCKRCLQKLEAQTKPNPGRSYLDRAIKEFGTTDDPGTGFFILPDGSFLDGSAGSGYMRADDHRILAGLYPNANKAEQKHGSRYALLVKVMQRANLIRWLPESWSADVVTQPTDYQIRTLEDLAQIRTLTVEVFRQTREFDSYNAERIEGWIDRVL